MLPWIACACRLDLGAIGRPGCWGRARRVLTAQLRLRTWALGDKACVLSLPKSHNRTLFLENAVPSCSKWPADLGETKVNQEIKIQSIPFFHENIYWALLGLMKGGKEIHIWEHVFWARFFTDTCNWNPRRVGESHKINAFPRWPLEEKLQMTQEHAHDPHS